MGTVDVLKRRESGLGLISKHHSHAADEKESQKLKEQKQTFKIFTQLDVTQSIKDDVNPKIYQYVEENVGGTSSRVHKEFVINTSKVKR